MKKRGSYDHIFGGDMPTRGKDPERYGFIWNSKRMKLLKVERNNNPGYYQHAGAFGLIRPPYYARFSPRGMQGGSNFELRLINTHIRDATREEERIQEFDTLVRQVLPRICDHREISLDGEIMPAYTFLLGDYNLSLNKSEQAIYRIEKVTQTSFTGKRRSFVTTQKEKTSLRLPHGQKTIEECYANDYDHFTYEIDLETKLTLRPERVEPLGNYFNEVALIEDKLKHYRKKVSDHVPIVMTINLK